MAKFLVAWTEEDWYNLEIEADSKDEALDKFYSQEYNYDDIRHIGSELQDSVEVEEII